MKPCSFAIWGKIQEKLPEQEHYEAKSFIGFNLIEEIEEVLAEINSFSTLALVSSNNKDMLFERNSYRTELSDEMETEINAFISYFKIRPADTHTDVSDSKAGNSKYLNNRGFSIDRIRSLLNAELKMLKKKLENLQTLVLSGVAGSVQLQGAISEKNDSEFITEPFSIEREEDESDLDYNVRAARLLLSRFNHKCERCMLSCNDREPSFDSNSVSKNWMQIDLNPDEGGSFSGYESNAESMGEKDDSLIGERLRELCRQQSGNKKDAHLRVSELLSPVSPRIIGQTPNSLKPLLTTATSSAAGFIKPLHLKRLHPLKMRPIVKPSDRFSRSKGCGHSGGDGPRLGPLSPPDSRGPTENSLIKSSKKLSSSRPASPLNPSERRTTDPKTKKTH